MTEDERRPWLIGAMEVGVRLTVRSLDLDYRDRRAYRSSSTDRMLPAGSMNQAMYGPPSAREMPFSS